MSGTVEERPRHRLAGSTSPTPPLGVESFVYLNSSLTTYLNSSLTTESATLRCASCSASRATRDARMSL